MSTTIYVNSLWNENTIFQDGKIFGETAFSSLDAAMKAAVAAGGADIVLTDETLETENLNKVVTKMTGASGMDFSITGTSAGNEFIAIEMRDDSKVNPAEDFTALATLTITDAKLNCYKLAAYQNSKITVENSFIDFKGDQSGPLYTKGNGELYIINSTIANTVQISAMGTLMSFNKSTLESGSGIQISGAMTFENGSTFTLSSAKIYGGTGVLTIEDSTMVRKDQRTAADEANALVYFVNGAANISTAKADYAYCVFVGGSQYSTTAHTGTGVMNVTNSTFDFSSDYADKNYAAIEGYENSYGLVGVGVGSALNITQGSTFNVDLLINEGAITIDATSSISADTLTNVGTITIDASDYTGSNVKVIDLNQASALSGVTLVNAEGYKLLYGNDGDVALVKNTPDFIYVSSDYNSSTLGWGYDRFSNYDSALAYVLNSGDTNLKKATIVFEKTITVSGNCLAQHDPANNKNAALAYLKFIIKDGAVMGNSASKLDMTYATTIEAGGILRSVRPPTAGYGNTHVKNNWIIGEAGAEKRAEIRYIKGKSGITNQTMSIALLSGFNRSITANNALIEVGDLGLQANASFTDTILTIDGILAIKGTGLYKTTMTDTEVTIKGHNLMNENTYYSTVGTIFGNLTMDNTSIVVDDGKDETVAEKVWFGYTGNTAQTLTVKNGSSIIVEEGTEVQVANKVEVSDSTIRVGTLDASATKAESFYFNQLEKNKVYWAVIYDAEGNEIETIVRTSTSGSTFYPKFSALPAGKYTARCFADEEKTQLHQEKTYSVVAIGSITLTNSDLYAVDLKLAGNNLTMDIDSTVGFASVSGGTITVTGSYEGGHYMLFDYTGTGSMTEADYKALLNNQWHNNYKVVNGDLYLTDQSNDTVYINGDWKDAEFGEVLENGSIVGFNAFADVKSAVASGASRIAVESDASGDWFARGEEVSGDLTISLADGVEAATLTANGGFYGADISADLNIGAGVTLDLAPAHSGTQSFATFSGKWDIDGTMIYGGADFDGIELTVSGTGKFLSYGTDNTSFRNGSIVNVTGTGTAEAKMGEVQFRTGQFGGFYGETTFTNSNVEMAGTTVTQMTGKVTIDNTVVNSAMGLDFGGYRGGYDDAATGTDAGFVGVITNSDITAADLRFIGGVITITDSVIKTDADSNPNGIDGAWKNTGAFKVYEGAVVNFAGINTITVEGAVTNNGVINFTIEAAEPAAEYLLFDANAASDYGTVTVTGLDSKYEIVTIAEDLYVLDMSTIYVNTAWEGYAAGAKIADGVYFGVNAFASLETISDAVSQGDRTVVYTYNGSNPAAKITVTNDAGTLLNYTFDGVSYNFYSGSRTHEVAFDSAETDVLTFDFNQGDFSFAMEEIEANVSSPATDNLTDTVLVTKDTGAKEYTFAVEANKIVDFTCAYDNVSGTGRIILYKDDVQISTRLFSNDGTFVANGLEAGNYKVVFASYDDRTKASFGLTFDFEEISANASVELEGDASFENVRISSEIGSKEYSFEVAEGKIVDFACTYAKVSGTGRLILYKGNDQVSSRLFSGAGTFTANGLEAGDYKLVFASYDDKTKVSFDVGFDFTESAANATAAIVNGTSYDDVKITSAAASKEYTFTVAAGTITDFTCAFENVSGTGRLTLFKDGVQVSSHLFSNDGTFTARDLASGNYKVLFAGYDDRTKVGFDVDFGFATSELEPSGVKPVSKLDDVRDKRGVLGYDAVKVADVAAWGGINDAIGLDNWVGTGDSVDWLGITNVAEGVRSVGIDVEGGALAVTLYSFAGDKYTTLAMFMVSDKCDGGVDVTRNVTLAAGSELVFSVTGMGADSKYSITIA